MHACVHATCSDHCTMTVAVVARGLPGLLGWTPVPADSMHDALACSPQHLLCKHYDSTSTPVGLNDSTSTPGNLMACAHALPNVLHAAFRCCMFCHQDSDLASFLYVLYFSACIFKSACMRAEAYVCCDTLHVSLSAGRLALEHLCTRLCIMCTCTLAGQVSCVG